MLPVMGKTRFASQAACVHLRLTLLFPVNAASLASSKTNMSRLFFPCLLSMLLCVASLRAGEKANTVLVHPGEVIYARFTQTGIKLKLVKASKEKDEQAQLILTFDAKDPDKTKYAFINLKVENKFDKDLIYKAQARAPTLNLRTMATVYPVVAGKMALVNLPPKVEEVAMFAFELEK